MTTPTPDQPGWAVCDDNKLRWRLPGDTGAPDAPVPTPPPPVHALASPRGRAARRRIGANTAALQRPQRRKKAS
jgi:hypothetical protein